MPRPSSRPTGAVWRLLERWSTEHPLRPNQAQMARLFGVSGSLLSNWKYCDSLMQTDDIALVAEKTGMEFERVAAAAAEDIPMARQAAARRRRPDAAWKNADGSMTIVEVKGGGSVGSAIEDMSEQVRSYVVALMSVDSEPATAEALNERLEEQHRVEPELAREAGVFISHVAGSGKTASMLHALLVMSSEEHQQVQRPFDLHLTAEDREFLDRIKVGDRASERPLARAARPGMSSGRTQRRLQDEDAEASQDIEVDTVTETGEQIIDADEQPQRVGDPQHADDEQR